MVSLFGILNLTPDSFSDGGAYADPVQAIARGLELVDAGAAVVDVGAESTNPDAEPVPAAEELRRLQAVVPGLLARGVQVSVDTHKPSVMTAMAGLGVQWLNDVRGFRSDESVAAAAASGCGLVVMFARSAQARAQRQDAPAATALAEMERFFGERVAALTAAGVARERLVLDPGMGFFLGSSPTPSLWVLKHLPALRRFGLPLLVSMSRKSFLGAVTGRPVAERGAATLAAELWAAMTGVDWIRTHDVRAARDALRVWTAIEAVGDAQG
jgi:dihydropteroate synthase